MTTFDEMKVWALGEVNADFDAVKRQIIEYGAIDLELMGQAMIELCGQKFVDPAQVGMEMALVHYLLGKISRAVSAIAAGQLPSSDTLRDITVYSMMLRHVRQFGHWNITGAEEDAAEVRSE